MPKNKIKWTLALVLLFLTFLALGQTIPDFSSINVSQLSDNQIEQLLKQASASGYSQEDLLQLAKSQGVSVDDIAKLGSRIGEVKSKRMAAALQSPINDSRLRKTYRDSLSITSSIESDIFGLNIFKNSSFLSFQSNLNVPTPENYILGPGDELFIDIYGQSESYYQAEINPDGNILLENVGPISVSGLSIKEAKSRIKSKLGNTYSDLNSRESSTFLSLTVGQLRTIRVSIVGSVQIPGTFTMSSLGSVFNALYTAGGITENGTLREIKIYRNSKLISVVDIYDFIVNGNSEKNITLQNDDVIIVGPYTNRVTLTGAVKIPGRFELKPDETLKTLIDYAGGFSDAAYSKTIKVSRIVDGERVIANVHTDQFEVFNPRPGDIFEVEEVLDRYKNRIVVKGAVFRPGDFSITEETTVKSIIEESEGIRPEAFLNRAYIIRTAQDLSTETISFDLGKLLNGELADIKLQREDVLNILSGNDLKSERYVEISGEVNNPGIYPYSEGMSLQDVILFAGGFNESATGKRIEVTRRVTDEKEDNFDLSELIVKDANLDFLNQQDEDPLLLRPFDNILIRRNPNFHIQEFVSIEGQVVYPGRYAIKNQGERISDLIERSGGLNDYAFIEGATLIRRTEFFEEETDIEQQIDDLVQLQQRLQLEPEALTESEYLLINRIEENLLRLEERNENNQSLSSFAKRERLKEILEKNSLLGNNQFKQAEAIGIKLSEILRNPSSNVDLVLEEGDVLIIPKKTETLRLRGKLLYPTTVRFEEGKSLKHYINSAGGFDNRAKRNGTYVVYANGEVARTKRFLWFKFYPKAARGAEIIVPSKPLKIPLRIQDVVAVTSGLATLALVVSQIANNNN
ncbi:SLBB domain-containing protein [Roseivirga sp. E12]|uniref:SLBB domain-containing protein n=1 Tax=Roseivirga sp. E12 TaxID=2819237 RepID=UPI001ABCD6CF|nr:SLBB domain-containing protein [Roseivirga sp. E12]MBO3699740.1 SLBB domain-containing protein [Roseivirga sp. E12]